jgi:hypothetical protein
MAPLSRREFLKRAGVAGAVLGIAPSACAHAKANGLPLVDPPTAEDMRRLTDWSARVRQATTNGALNSRAAMVGTYAIGTPYEAFTLERYLKEGGDATQREPLALSLTKFDCVTLVESCLAVARAAIATGKPAWEAFGEQVERMRYRNGARLGFTSRLHYFSEWISDGARRGLVRDLGAELGGATDSRPLRFMTEHRSSYPGLRSDSVFAEIAAMERSLDSRPRHFIPTDRIKSVEDSIQSGDILAFATSIPGLDVTHAAFAYRDGAGGPLTVLHAPLSGGSVEISRRTLSDYVTAIKRSTGIMVARPLS